MCILIEQPKGITLKLSALKDFATRNAHGFGAVVWDRDGTPRVYRTTDHAESIELYREHAAGRHAVLHWRMATAGTKGLENVHPFAVGPDTYLLHNGMLDIPADGAASDTAVFAARIVAPLFAQVGEALFTGEYADVLGGLIGSSNRLAIVGPRDRVQLVNRHLGVEHGGCWYSNTYAWDAPAHLSRRAWRGYDVTDYRTTAPAPVRVTPAAAGGVVDPRAGWLWPDEYADRSAYLDRVDADDDDDADGIEEQEAAHILATGGTGALTDWVERNPEGAYAVLRRCCGSEYADEMASDDPERIAEVLADWLDAVPF